MNRSWNCPCMKERIPGTSEASITVQRPAVHRQGELSVLMIPWSHVPFGPDRAHRPPTCTGKSRESSAACSARETTAAIVREDGEPHEEIAAPINMPAAPSHVATCRCTPTDRRIAPGTARPR